MPDYVKLAATAQRLVEKNGRTVTLYKRNRAPADATKPHRGPAVAPIANDGAVVTALCCFVPVSGSGLSSKGERRGDLFVEYDSAALVAATSLPAGTDLVQFGKLVDGKNTWEIARVEPLQPAGVVLIYALGLIR